MNGVEINWLAVVLAGVSSIVVGWVWYSRGVFGNTWARLAKVKQDPNMPMSAMVQPIVLSLVAGLVTAYVLALAGWVAHQYFNDSLVVDMLWSAAWLWLGFTVARQVTHDAFENRPTKLTVLVSASELLTVVVMALILGWIKP